MITALIASSALLGLLLASGGRITPFYLVLLTLLQTLAGYHMLVTTWGGRDTEAWFSVAILILLAAYSLPGFPSVGNRIDLGKGTSSPHGAGRSVSSAWVVLVLMTSLSVYHFAVVGVPILSDDVEVNRYSFTESGLFGLPGRAVQFGTVIAFFFCAHHTRKFGGRGLASAAFAVLLLTRMLLGFKAGVWEACLFLVLAEVTLNPGRARLPQLTSRYLLLAVFAALYALVLAGQYATVTTNNDSLFAYLWERATVESAAPGYYLTTGIVDPGVSQGGSFSWDIAYYSRKYIGLHPENPGPFVKMLSASMTSPIASWSAIEDAVPVTVGLWSRLCWDFGIAAAMAIFAFVGLAFGWLERRSVDAASGISFIAATGGIVALYDVTTKGDPVYSVLNWGAMCALVALVDLGVRGIVAPRSFGRAYKVRGCSG